MKSSKKWCISFLVSAAAVLLAFSLMMYITDPLLQYRPESNLFSYWSFMETYSNPGIAKNYEYDSVLVGSSMMQNTEISDCNNFLDGNFIRETFSGANSYNIKKGLDVCFSSKKNIKQVAWCLDELAFLGDPYVPSYPLPEYLYNDNIFDDTGYLLNIDICFDFNVKNLFNSLKGETQKAMPTGNTWGSKSVFSKATVIDYYNKVLKDIEVVNYDTYVYHENCVNNLEKNILPLIKSHPETKFLFFMPPYSMVEWYVRIKNGSFDACMYSLNYSLGELLPYDNVEVFFYQNEYDIITNLDNYKDTTHYAPWVNSYLIESVSKGKSKLTLDNYNSVLTEFKSFLQSYDYDNLLDLNEE